MNTPEIGHHNIPIKAEGSKRSLQSKMEQGTVNAHFLYSCALKIILKVLKCIDLHSSIM